MNREGERRSGNTRRLRSPESITPPGQQPSGQEGEPSSAPEPQTLAERVRQAEDRIRQQTFETAYAYNGQGVEVLRKDGQVDSITFTPVELSRLKDAVMVHNHPGGLLYPSTDLRHVGQSFSLDDIEFAVTNDLAEIRVVTPVLRFSLRRPVEGWPDLVDLHEAYRLASNVVTAQSLMGITRGTITVEGAEARHFDALWTRVAQRLGLSYTREES